MAQPALILLLHDNKGHNQQWESKHQLSVSMAQSRNRSKACAKQLLSETLPSILLSL